MKHISVSIYILFSLFFLFFNCANEPQINWDTVPQILEKIIPPTFPENDYNITNYGAVADGITDCSDAIKKAISECNKAGGGRVIIPDGIFMTGPIHLLNNVNLYLSDNAVLRFFTDPEKYIPFVFSRWEGVELMNYSPLIYAFEKQNIAITGKGTLDGQAGKNLWWHWSSNPQYGWKEGLPTETNIRKLLFEMAENNIPPKERIFPNGSTLCPPLIQLYSCENIIIDGPTIINSPMWQLHPVLCKNVTIQNVNLKSLGPNSDGVVIESCNNVFVSHTKVQSKTDCISIKSGRNADGRRINKPSKNIVIENCELNVGNCGVTIGSELSGGIKNIFVRNCELIGQVRDHAVRIKTNSVRGGFARNIYFKDINISRVANSVIWINYYYNEGDAGKFAPKVQDIFFENISCLSSTFGVFFVGYSDSPISNIYLKNCEFENVKNGNRLINVKNIVSNSSLFNGLSFNSIDEKILPKPVIATLEREIGNGIVERLNENPQNTGSNYEFRVLVNGERSFLRIYQDGSLL